MKIISHRGNIDGPIVSIENSPSYIQTAILLGVDVEVDIRFNSGFFLGHDTETYEVTPSWILEYHQNIWFHCKNLDSAYNLKSLNNNIKYFCHSSDPYVLISNGKYWVHDLSLNLTNDCIVPLIDKNSVLSFSNNNVFGICTDFIKYYDIL